VQVAALLGCSTAHVYLLCEQGKFAAGRPSRSQVQCPAQHSAVEPDRVTDVPEVGQNRKTLDAQTSSSTSQSPINRRLLDELFDLIRGKVVFFDDLP